MDHRFLQYYERELRFIRELGAEFVRHFPKVAGRLGLSELACEDPHVERLLQGYAFLAGRAHMALDAEFPAFTQPLTERIYPNCLAPTPAMAVAQFSVDSHSGSLADGFTIPRGTPLRARGGVRDGIACEFRTAHGVELLPLSIERVEYTSVLRDIADVRLPTSEPIRALLKLRLRSHHMRFERVRLSTLPLFVRGADELSARLYEQLIASARGLVLRWGSEAVVSSDARPVRPLGFDAEHALLPQPAPAFEGYRLLQEYFAFPARFHFVELTGLAPGAARCASDRLELIVPLAHFDPALEGAIDETRLLPFATPVINLFPLDCGRVALPKHAGELKVVPDRTQPLDFEVHSLTRVAAYSADGEAAVELKPMHVTQAGQGAAGHAHYATERRVAPVSQRQSGGGLRSAYAGSELFLRVREPVPGVERVERPQWQQLGLHALCTNRDLPLSLSLGHGGNDFELRSGVPADAVRCIAGPTPPRAAPMDGALAWHMLSHLSLNYLSLCEETGGVQALRELLGSFAQLGDPALRRQVDGVCGLRSAPVVGPWPCAGPRTFVRGLAIQLQCEEQAFAGHGVFTLGSVLSAFFAKHASHHSFAQTTLTTSERGEVYRWPAVPGLRHVS